MFLLVIRGKNGFKAKTMRLCCGDAKALLEAYDLLNETEGSEFISPTVYYLEPDGKTASRLLTTEVVKELFEK